MRSLETSSRLARRIIEWYEVSNRDLPWRREPFRSNPYCVYVSEIMLQQTQVRTVIPYWTRWMQLFPNVHVLAQAKETEVLKAWEGLGYYSRARNAQKAARIIVGEHAGKFPEDYLQVLALPGIGRYTAGAICSIAYGQPTAILDGNVARVLSRLYLVGGNIKSSDVQKHLWHLSAELVQQAGRASRKNAQACSHFNQGLMELGATVCTSVNPACDRCPIATHCLARRLGVVSKYPEPAARPPQKNRLFYALVIKSAQGVLVRQRPAGVVNAGLWEFPNFEVDRKTKRRNQVESFLGGPKPKISPFLEIKHSITTSRITLRVFQWDLAENSDAALTHSSSWRLIPELADLPFTAAHAKIRAKLWEQLPAPRFDSLIASAKGVAGQVRIQPVRALR